MVNVPPSATPVMPRALNRPTAWLAEGALEDMLAEGQRRLPQETGGILMGYQTEAAVVITDVIGPGPAALHKRKNFVPDAAFQEGEIGRIYGSSGRIHTYLGDWHTHPGADAVPSPRDIATLQRIAETPTARMPSPVMAILAYRAREWWIQVWHYSEHNRPRIQALPITFYTA